MKAQRIVELLYEASQIGMTNPIPSAGETRLARIQVEFQHALYQGRDDDQFLRNTAQTILDNLFVSTVEHRPERLLELYPVFDLLCGERSSDWIGDVGWDIADLAHTLSRNLPTRIRRRPIDPFSFANLEELEAVIKGQTETLRRRGRHDDDPVRASLQKLKEMSCPTHHSFVLRPDGTRACGKPSCNWTDNLGSEATNWMPPPK